MNMMLRQSCRSFPASLLEDVLTEPFFAISPMQSRREATTPGNLAVDVSETDKAVLIRASLPGFKKEDITIEVHEGVLTIDATQTEAKDESNERYHRRERRTMSLRRSVALPGSVHEEHASAELKDGVLTLTLPKHEQALPKKISVN